MRFATSSENCRKRLLYVGKAWLPFGLFLPFAAPFGFSYQQKTKTSNAILKWKYLQKPKRATKSQNKQTKAFACFGFLR